MHTTSLLLFSFASLAASEADISWFPTDWPEPGRFLWGGEWDAGEFVHDVLHDRETPVAVFYPMNFHNLELTCVVLYSNWKDKLSKDEPPYRMPESMWTSYHRMTCIIYARIYWFGKAGSFWRAKQQAIEQLEEGVGEGTLMPPETLENLEYCFKQYTMPSLAWLREACIQREMNRAVDQNNHLQMASFAGAVVAEYILNDMRTTQAAWNWDGSRFSDGKPCENNCAPFMDWTGYTPVNSAHEIRDPTRWQPLTESDKKGYSFVQEHVAAQLSEMDLIIGDAAMYNRQAPDPQLDYQSEMTQVYWRMNEFSKDNDRIAKTKIMDNKLAVLIRIMIAIDTVRPWSLESAALFLSLFVTTEHDALIMAWKEKLYWDLIRPTSISMMMGGMWEDKDADGVWTKKATEEQPLIPRRRRRRRVEEEHVEDRKLQYGIGYGGGSGRYSWSSNYSNGSTYSNGDDSTSQNGDDSPSQNGDFTAPNFGPGAESQNGELTAPNFGPGADAVEVNETNEADSYGANAIEANGSTVVDSNGSEIEIEGEADSNGSTEIEAPLNSEMGEADTNGAYEVDSNGSKIEIEALPNSGMGEADSNGSTEVHSDGSIEIEAPLETSEVGGADSNRSSNKAPLNLEVVDRVPFIKDQFIDPTQWTPFIRVMPHSEYPSGSMAICQAVADFTKLFLPLDNRATPLRVNWPLEKGKAGYGLPTEDVDAWTESMDEFAEVCGQSRLWGGMHFTKAVPAAKDLVEGLGEMAFDLANLILNGNELKPHENLREQAPPPLERCGQYRSGDTCSPTPHCRWNASRSRCITGVCLKFREPKIIYDEKICAEVRALGYCASYRNGRCSRT